MPVIIQPWLQDFFRIEDVRISGRIQFASSERIQETLASHLEEKALYQIDVAGLAADMLDVPWVETVQVERIWPHELVLVIEETVPIAVWNDDKILSDGGDIFKPSSIEAHKALPVLRGSDKQVHAIMDMYRQTSKILRQVNLTLVEIAYDKGLVWHLTVEAEGDGFLLVFDGDSSFDRLYRFVNHYPSLARMKKVPQRIDLRYPTGMAVSWK